MRGHGEKITGRREWAKKEKCGCDRGFRGTSAFSAASLIKLLEVQSQPKPALSRAVGSRDSLCPIPVLIPGPKLSGGSINIC